MRFQETQICSLIAMEWVGNIECSRANLNINKKRNKLPYSNSGNYAINYPMAGIN